MISATGNNRGFTLVEAWLVMALLGMMLAVSWPSYRTISKKRIIRAEATRLLEALYHHREEAIQQGTFQLLDFQVGRFVQAEVSSPSIRFYPDGTADYFKAEFLLNGRKETTVEVKEDGRIREY